MSIGLTDLFITDSTLPDNKLHKFVTSFKLQVPMMGHGCYALGKHVSHLYTNDKRLQLKYFT